MRAGNEKPKVHETQHGFRSSTSLWLGRYLDHKVRRKIAVWTTLVVLGNSFTYFGGLRSTYMGTYKHPVDYRWSSPGYTMELPTVQLPETTALLLDPAVTLRVQVPNNHN